MLGFSGNELLIHAELTDAHPMKDVFPFNFPAFTKCDAFEIFLGPTDGKAYYELHVTPSNSILQLFFDGSGVRKTIEHHAVEEPLFTSRTEFTPEGWSVEARIPLAKLFLGKHPEWHLSFGRYDRTPGIPKPVISTTSPHAVCDFHRKHEWGKVRLADLPSTVPGKKSNWKEANDLSANFLMKWDESTLYIAAIVRDESHVQNAPLNLTWSEDAVALSLLMMVPGKPDSRHEYFFAAYPDRDEILPTTKDAMESRGSQVRFKSTLNRNEGTCVYEMAIPWDRLAPFAPAAGEKFSLTVAVSDADAVPGKGFNYLSWTPGIHYGKSPSGMADITLIKSK